MSNIRFPQGPIVDVAGYITLEWQQWFQNPEVVSLFIGALSVNTVPLTIPLQNTLTPAELMPVIGSDGSTRYAVLYE